MNPARTQLGISFFPKHAEFVTLDFGTLGLWDFWTFGLLDFGTLGLLDFGLWTCGLFDLLTVGLWDLLTFRLSLFFGGGDISTV